MANSASRFAPLVLVIVALVASVVGGCNSKTTDDSIEPITLDELRKEMDDGRAMERLLLLDARSPKEFASGHIPSARNVPWEKIGDTPADLDPKLDRYRSKVVYGENRGSGSARALTKRMIQAGYSKVRMFAGGLEEWRRAGLPVVEGP